MSTNEEDKIDKLTRLVEKMNRGLYGDEENKQKGLMQVVYENVEDVKQIKDREKKRTWMAAGAAAVLSLVSPLAAEWIKQRI